MYHMPMIIPFPCTEVVIPPCIKKYAEQVRSESLPLKMHDQRTRKDIVSVGMKLKYRGVEPVLVAGQNVIAQ